VNAESLGWSVFRLVFAAESPIHIGWHELGLIQRTRYWIPARNFWGAAIANGTRRVESEPVSEAYKRTTGSVNRTLRFTNFYPTVTPERDGAGFRPSYQRSKGLLYGEVTAAQFESEWVHSQTSTALAPERLSAEDGALHESEYLAPRRASDAARLYFEGYALARGAEAAEWLRAALALCLIGADRRYGWGRLRLLNGASGMSPRATMFDGFRPDGEEPSLEVDGPPDPVVTSDGEVTLPAHVIADGVDGTEGDLEPVGGRDWNGKGSGGAVLKPKLCWTPGSICDGVRHFAIGPTGLWRMLAATSPGRT
jgi:hypothetical protein